MNLVSQYRDIPVSNWWGVGNYTYNFILDNQVTGVVKSNVFASNVDEAMYIIGCYVGNILGFSYINNDIISLEIDGFIGSTCLLYLS